MSSSLVVESVYPDNLHTNTNTPTPHNVRNAFRNYSILSSNRIEKKLYFLFQFLRMYSKQTKFYKVIPPEFYL